MKPTPQLFRYVRPLLAILFVVGCLGFLFTLVWRAVPEENKELVLQAQGYILATLSLVLGYYFGSSKDKSDQDQARTLADAQPDKVDTAVITADTATVNANTTT